MLDRGKHKIIMKTSLTLESKVTPTLWGFAVIGFKTPALLGYPVSPRSERNAVKARAPSPVGAE